MIPSASSENNLKFDATFLDNLKNDCQNKSKASNFIFSLLRHHALFLIIFFAAIGFLLPDFYAHKKGFPVPHIHDEFSYLLAADTFASGRITNQTPEFYEHFESPHLLVEPTYMSKFPPAQGLILALGQILFGNPIYGVWISCGLFAAALFWMLSVWADSRWAFFGTAVMLLFVGTEGYWSQSFWGGTIAAFGGCLFFGSFRQLLNKISFGGVFPLVFGGTILMNSRPFEGLLTMTPALIFLLVRIIKNENLSLTQKSRRFFLPAFLLAFAGVSAMAFYNFKITGKLSTFPYTIHQSEYFSTPLFVFQSPLKSELRGTPRLQALYGELSTSLPLRDLEEYNLPESKIIRSFFAVLYLAVKLPLFLISLPLTLFLYIFLIPVVRKNNLLILIAGTILFTFAGMSLATYWEKCHYAAPLTACFYLLLVEAFRYCASFFGKDSRIKYIPVFIAVLAFLVFFDWLGRTTDFYHPATIPAAETGLLNELSDEKTVSLKIYERATYLKPEIENYFENQPEKYLAIVSYAENQTPHDEIVFNKSDIENSKFIWAYDLGEEKNKNLVNHFGDRKIIYVNVSPSEIKLGFQPPEN